MRRSSHNRMALVLAAAASAVAVGPVMAANMSWTKAGDGNWVDVSPNGWNNSAYPGQNATSDNVYISNGYGVTLNSAIPNAVVNVNLGNSSTGRLDIAPGASLNATTLNVMSVAAKEGTVNQTGGTFSAAVVLGNSLTGTATYNLSGGTLTTSNLSVPNSSKGTMVQTGGTVDATRITFGGTNSTSSYSMSDGTLNVTGASFAAFNLTSSANGPASFSQSGGVVNVAAGTNVFYWTGASATNNVLFNLSGGTFNANNGITLGNNMAGTISGGVLNMGNTNLMVSGTGTLSFTGGTIEGAAAAYQVVMNGAGAVFKVGGNVNAASTTQIGNSTFAPQAGTVLFTAYGNGSASSFLGTGTTGSINLSDADVNVVVGFADGYIPQAGDSFDFVTPAVSGTFTGTTSNLVLPGGMEWDTSQWESLGILTVVSVPEPAGIVLLGMSALCLIRRRR